ncbi:FHA domain-containing protein [Streptomyces sp. NRRL B-24484]|uniref:FHA domain-containing protein n=1 Tax=Streptomyces sp. NRRL B-24484 TaxID=1463833 RepID=UPI0004C033D4|nr:FHA domain-containing protein [Streptomyces sp. NRRL B-24484]
MPYGAVERCDCGTARPDGRQLVCRGCLTPYTLLRPGPVLRLVFPTGAVELAAGEQAVLGRDPVQSPYAYLFRDLLTVSARHLRAGLAPGGPAWVEDLGSTNRTTLNRRRLPPGERRPLADGDRLRLARDIPVRVHLTPGEP